MKILMKITVVLFILVSCEKMDQPDIAYDCQIKSTVFDSNDEVLGWEISYYKNGNNVKQESSYGAVSETKYDNRGNVICYCSGNERTEYEYNLFDKVVRETYYIDNQMEYYVSLIFKDTLVEKTYRINNAGDTIYTASHYYNSANKIDSVISNEKNWHYFYFAEGDSLLITNKERMTEMAFINKYENGRKIYSEYRTHDEQGQVSGYQITTSEFDDDGLLTRRTEVYYHFMIHTTPGTSYTKYYYEDSVLSKTETLDGNNNLQNYTLFENTCK